MYIFTYMRTEFTCVGICLRICTQGLYVYVNILRIYTQSSHVRVNMIANLHIEFTYVCVYFGVYSHEVHMCVCTWFCIFTQSWTQNLHVYVYMVTYIHRGSTRGCVSGYVFTYIHTEFTSVCIYLRIYVCVYNCVYIHRFYMCVYIDLRIWTPRLYVCV